MSESDWRKEARARCEAATKGPWFNRQGGYNKTGIPKIYSDPEKDSYVAHATSNGDFIAHARTDLPRALDLLDELEAWLRATKCNTCVHTEYIDPDAEKNCQDCGGEGTEWARFQRHMETK